LRALGVDFTQIIIMLRRTNRLKQLLASHGMELWLGNNAFAGEDIPPSRIVEAECSQEQQRELAELSGLFDMLAVIVELADSFVLKAIVQREFAPEQPNHDWERDVSVLWLSDRAFVTRYSLPTV
jgi:hypothetical protein